MTMKISRKTALKSFLASVISVPLFANTRKNQTLVDVKTDLLTSWNNSEKYTLTFIIKCLKINWTGSTHPNQ